MYLGMLMGVFGTWLAAVLSLTPNGVTAESGLSQASRFCLPTDVVVPASAAAADIDTLTRSIVRLHPDPDWASGRGGRGRFAPAAAAINADALAGPHCLASVTWLASRVLALTADGHSRVTNAALTTAFGTAAWRAVWRGDRLVVQALQRSDSAFVGAEVEAINGMALADLMARLRDVVPANDDFEFLRYSERYLFKTRLINALTGRPPSGSLVLTLRTAERTANVTVAEQLPGVRLTVLDRDLRPDPLADREPGRYVRWAALGDVFLLRLNAVANQPGAGFSAAVAAAFAAFDSSGATHFLVDLRGNGGGNGALGPFVTAGVRARPSLRRPGAVLVGTDKYTYSAAVTLRNNLEWRGDAVPVGESAGGWPFHPGDNADLTLPASRVAVEISTVYHHMPLAVGDRHPELALHVAQDAAAWRQGTDPLLDAVLAGRVPAPVLVPPGALREGRYAISPAHTLHVYRSAGGLRGAVFPVVDSWVRSAGESGVYRLASGLELRAAASGVAVRLPGEAWRTLPRRTAPAAWDLIESGDAARGRAALIDAARAGAPGTDDAGLSFVASQIYAELMAVGREREQALPIVRAVLEAATQINDDSPFADFSLTIYR